MATNIIKCPVCGEELTSFVSFCPVCSFEIHILPESASKQVKELEDLRIENAQRAYSIQAQIISIKDKKIEQLKSCTAPLEVKIANLQEQNRQMQDNLGKKQEEVAIMNQQVKKLKNDVDAANAILSEKMSSVSGKKIPFAYLVVFNGQDAQRVLNLFDGDNSFGSDPDSEHHQQLYGDSDIQGLHFVIKASVSVNSRGRRKASYKIAPAQGAVFRAANQGNIINGEEPIEINDSIYAGSFKFTLLDNKNNINKE